MGFKESISNDEVDIVKALLRKKYIPDDMVAYAVENGSLEMIEMLFHEGVDVKNYLWAACESQREAVVDYLLTIGADPNNQGSLSIVCENGNEAIFGALINAGASVNMDCGFYHPLLMAASNGHHGIVGQLYDLGVDVDYQDPNGNNALHLACRDDDYNMVCLLLSYGVPVVANDSRLYPYQMTSDEDIIKLFEQ